MGTVPQSSVETQLKKPMVWVTRCRCFHLGPSCSLGQAVPACEVGVRDPSSPRLRREPRLGCEVAPGLTPSSPPCLPAA